MDSPEALWKPLPFLRTTPPGPRTHCQTRIQGPPSTADRSPSSMFISSSDMAAQRGSAAEGGTERRVRE